MSHQDTNLHPHYTLPGVMHYLQTEFTKNERDRIAWELERSEMKARIAQLEGENKDLHYKLMKLKSSTGNNDGNQDSAVNGVDLTELMKSKMAVQDNVKEIIYLFKSPNITTQLRSLNEKKDAVHSLERMNLNQSIENGSTNVSGDVPGISSHTHQDEALQEAMREQQPRPLNDSSSDAATVVVNNEIHRDTYNDVRPHRSSSLFTPAKVALVQSIQPNQETPIASGIEDSGKTSDLTQGTPEISQLKAFQNQLIAYSEDGRLTLWHIDNSLKCGELPVKNFGGISSPVLDIYWLDMGKFLVLDNEGIKLFTSESEQPVSQLPLFLSKNNNSGILYSDLIGHDFKCNAVLLATGQTVHVLEMAITINNFTSSIKETKRFTISTQRELSAVKFGMTEKSVIVLHNNPYEILIYNLKGEVLQKIDLSKFFSGDLFEVVKPLVHLNKRSSKLLIQFQKMLLVYSFDQKKIVLKYTLTSQPTHIIFRSPKDSVIVAYEDGSIEERNLSNFDTIIKKYDGSHSELTALDSTTINSKSVVVSSDKNGEFRLNTLQDGK